MKLHLPSSLRKALLLALAAVSTTLEIQSAAASVLFDGVGLQTYADFGQNCGRYVAGEVNAMLKAIRDKDQGIAITYQSDAYQPYIIPNEQGMIDFASASSNPVAAAVGYAYLATVSHNGIIAPTYSALEVGNQNAIHYNSIDFRRGTPFHMESVTDFKIARLNKIVTDVQPTEFYSGTNPGAELNGQYLYRTGSGAMELALVDGDGIWRRTQVMELHYTFSTGGIVTIEWAEGTHKGATDGNFGIFHHVTPKVSEEISNNPLPYRVRSGDSGSPSWVYNTETKTYQYISAGQSGGQYFSQDRGDVIWSKHAMESCGVRAQLGGNGADHTITLSAVTNQEEKITGVGDTVEVSTIPHSGTLSYTDADGQQQSVKYIGIQKDKHTWKDLSAVKDKDNWFNYGEEYFNVAQYGPTDAKPNAFSFADMFVTDNLVFEAGDSSTYNIVLQDNVDLGVGFVQLSKAEGVQSASFKLQSSYALDSAGFGIDEGATLELDMKAPEDRMVEWRKAGAGDLRITGSGNTNALLNVGGSGTVSLEHKTGYAAYNVLASSGSTLVVNDLKQVYRDVTLGAGGATLDLNGNDFTWNNSAPLDDNGFKSLHLLVEKDVVTNNKANSAITITIEDPGEEAFVGAFKDTAEGAIKVVYKGDSDKTWVMNTVFTNLKTNKESSFTVENGSVALQGINTVHGKQILGRRIVNYFDWHYADATMDVIVGDGAEFTLGSHARLTGDVTVKNGGTFTMTEYTTHQFEYLEGGVKKDDTYEFRKYFGLHGDINLEGEDSTFNVAFSPRHQYQDTDSESVYDGKITGLGGMVVDTAGGSLKLTNAGNNFTGAKELVGGTLVSTSTNALGDTNENKWIIHERGVLAVEKAGISDILPKIAGEYEEESFWGTETKYSNGVLALTQNETGPAPVLSGYQKLIIGAIGDIQFGEEGTTNALAANNEHEWHLGGGGGTLYVNYKLADDAGVLVLGNQYTTGKVVLTNENNKIDRIELVGGVTLDYKSEQALGHADVLLEYGNRMMGSAVLVALVTQNSDGAVLLDQMSDAETINLATHATLSLAAHKEATITGTIDLGEHDTYHFGGGGGHLVLDTILAEGNGFVRNMLVDGQFYRPIYEADEGQSYGSDIIELKQALQLTGNVTVRGFDATRAPEDDPTYIFFNSSLSTLQLSVDNALSSVNALILADGGFVDMNGTTQTLHGFKTDEALLGWYGIVDYSEAQTSKLILDVAKEDESERWNPILCNLEAHELVKTGDGTLILGGSNESSLFTIQDGTVEIYSNDSLNSAGVTRVENTGVLDVSVLEDKLGNKTIELNKGGNMRIGADAISGRISVNEGTGTLDAGEASATLDAAIGAAKQATLVLQGSGFTLKNAQNNVQGGIIELQADTLSLSNAEGVSIGGTLKVSNNNATLLNASAANAVHNIACLHMDAANLTIDGDKNKAVQWNVNALDGSGKVVMQTGTAASSLRLGGEGSFSGVLQIQGGVEGTPGLVLAHDQAAKAATIDLLENSGKHASMEVTAANAHIMGLTGSASSKVYAGVEGATLTTSGSQTNNYDGFILDNQGMRLNLVHEGTGHQTYSGSLKVNNISVQDGKLTVNTQNLDLDGNVTVVRGTVLSLMNGPLQLNEGHSLCVTGNAEEAGIVSGGITFNGGALCFDAAGLDSQSASLQFNDGVTAAGNVTVDFANVSCLASGSILSLTSGYSWDTANLAASGLEYLKAAFAMEGNILKVSFSQKEGNRIWDGSEEKHSWSSSEFGQQHAVLQTNEVAVFNDSASSKEVEMTDNVVVSSLLFDNTETYTVNTENGSLTAERATLRGSGDVVFGKHTVVNTAVEIAAGGTLVLQDTDTLQADSMVSGEGTIAIDGDLSASQSLDGKLSHIGGVEVRSGTLAVADALSAGNLVVKTGAALHATTGSILADGETVHSSGTVQINTSGNTNLTTNIAAGEEGDTGIFVKGGNGTLYVKSSVVADTVRVEQGRLEVNMAGLPAFLPTVGTVEVNSGASTLIGGMNETTKLAQVDTDFTVNGGTLELALAQHANALVAANVTINGGTLQKKDGGLRFTGTTILGSTAQDKVTLAGNWGKGGMIFDGEVNGSGHVTLTKGNSVEKFTFNNGDNAFSGEIKATAGTQLVAGHKTALAQASNINLENNSTLVLATGEVDIKSLNGSGSVEFSPADVSTSTTLHITDSGSFAGTVGGNISITKSGKGDLRLSGNLSTFNGTLSIEGGSVTLDTATLANPETIVSSGVLELTQTVNSFNGSLAVNNGATLKLAEMGEQAISVGTLKLDNGAILDVTALNISAGQSAPITLIKGGNIASPADVTVNFGSAEPAYYALAIENNNLMLTFVPPAQDLIWDGNANSNWTSTDKNWHTAAESEVHVAFTKNANVTFEGGTRTVDLTEHIIAGDMKLASGADVTLRSEGSFEHEFIYVTIDDGAKLSFGEKCSTNIKGTLALDGTVTNGGTLAIALGSVSSDATGVIGGTGETAFSGTIENAGTVVLDNANLTGSGEARITGNVVIDGGTLSGTMELGAKGSKVTVANMFTLGDTANYTIKGDLVLDALQPDELNYYGSISEEEQNGFIVHVVVSAYTGKTGEFKLEQGVNATYKGLSVDLQDGKFVNDVGDFSTFHVNTGEQGMESYENAKSRANDFDYGDDFKNVQLAAGASFNMDSQGAHLEKVTARGNENAASLLISESATIDSVEVEAGILNILNDARVEVKGVSIGANSTLGVYKGAEAPELPSTENEDTLTIQDSQTLTAKGAGATLNANLVMETGSILDVFATGGSGLALGSTLTLNRGMNLSSEDLSNVMGLMAGKSYILFNGVNSLTLDQTTYTEAITPGTKVDAADWFNGLAAESYYMVYDGSGVGQVAIFSATPEPTTSTLSLLALAALAARRRRK